MVFFFKQNTAYEMRISDWSSDVCSSDLPERGLLVRRHLDADQDAAVLGAVVAVVEQADVPVRVQLAEEAGQRAGAFGKFEAVQQKIGRASCRERGCQYL